MILQSMPCHPIQKFNLKAFNNFFKSLINITIIWEVNSFLRNVQKEQDLKLNSAKCSSLSKKNQILVCKLISVCVWAPGDAAAVELQLFTSPQAKSKHQQLHSAMLSDSQQLLSSTAISQTDSKQLLSWTAVSQVDSQQLLSWTAVSHTDSQQLLCQTAVIQTDRLQLHSWTAVSQTDRQQLLTVNGQLLVRRTDSSYLAGQL